MAKSKKISCPACGSTTGVEMVHAPPTSQAGKAAVRYTGSPRHRCIRCGYEW